jgi:4-hydroxy-tetrahydrodipicolinate synthase
MSLSQAAAQNLRQALATVVVVPVTPLHADGHPDWDTYAALTRRLIDGGITVITPNGNTGEFYALSPAEARQATETAAKTSSNAAELLAGVGHDIATAVESALAQLGLCRADVRPPSRPLPADVKDEIRAILAGWGLA